MANDGVSVDFSAVHDFLESAATFKDKKQIVLAAMRRAARPVANKFKTAYRSKGTGAGNLRRSLGVWAGITRTRGFTALAGARQFGSHKGHHAHLYEFGTGERKTKDGQSRGKMPGAHQWGNISMNKEGSAERLKDELITAFKRHIAKKQRQYA